MTLQLISASKAFKNVLFCFVFKFCFVCFQRKLNPHSPFHYYYQNQSLYFLLFSPVSCGPDLSKCSVSLGICHMKYFTSVRTPHFLKQLAFNCLSNFQWVLLALFFSPCRCVSFTFIYATLSGILERAERNAFFPSILFYQKSSLNTKTIKTFHSYPRL